MLGFRLESKPFEIEILQPFEPAGSIHYYPEQQYAALVAQGIQQAAIDEIKNVIFEIWPGVAAACQNVKIQMESMPKDFKELKSEFDNNISISENVKIIIIQI